MFYFSGFIIAVVLAFVLLYLVFMQNSPEQIIDLGFINFLLDNPGAALGALIGMLAVSFTVILPALTSIPKSIREFANQRRLSQLPIKVTGQVITSIRSVTHTSIEVTYAGVNNNFRVDNRLLSQNLARGSNLLVFYDPRNKANAYIDIIGSLEQDNSVITDSGTVFKLLEITPRFDINSNSFELIGELYGSDFEAQKASLVYEFSLAEVSHYTPGKLYPCTVHGAKGNYSISILAS